MRRIGLAVVLVLSLIFAPLALEAQQAGKMPTVGILQPGVSLSADVDAFRQGLREHGYIPGENIVLEYRPSQLQIARSSPNSSVSTSTSS